MFTRLPMRMELTSPRSTVPNQDAAFVAHHDITYHTGVVRQKQSFPISGVKPLTDLIMATLVWFPSIG